MLSEIILYDGRVFDVVEHSTKNSIWCSECSTRFHLEYNRTMENETEGDRESILHESLRTWCPNCCSK